MITKNLSSLHKRIILTGTVALLALGLIISYFAVFAKMIPEDDQTPSSDLVLIDGEIGLGTYAFYLYPALNASTIQKISVENTHGSFSLTRAQSGSKFYLNDNKNATYDDNMFASLVVAVGSAITNDRVVPPLNEGAMPEYVDYVNYGLTEELMTARYTVTGQDGSSYTVRIGDKVASGDGYYACLEGRNAVYILGTDIESTVLGTVESIVTPTIAPSMSTDDYYTTDYFTLWKNGKHYVTIHYLEDAEEVQKYAAVSNYLMTFEQNVSPTELLNATTKTALDRILDFDVLPYSYTPAIDEYAAILETLTSFQGDETVAIKKPGTQGITEAQLLEYGINPKKPAYELFYNYNGLNISILFSEMDREGYYYAYSLDYDLIVKISADKVSFFEWTFPEWVESSFFQKNIKNIKEIQLLTNSIDYNYELQHSTDDSGNAALTVRANGKVLDTVNFREFYKVMLTRKFRGDFKGDIPSEDTWYMTLRVITTAGVETEYKFYRYSTQSMYMTVNGKGEFYILSSMMHKLESDAKKLFSGELVRAYDRN